MWSDGGIIEVKCDQHCGVKRRGEQGSHLGCEVVETMWRQQKEAEA
jgi:hypothetical protein